MNNINKLYSPQDIMNILQQQFVELMQEDYEFYRRYKIKLANEQYYVDPEDRKEPGNIYIVVKFLPADINYKQNIVPFSITAVSEHDGLEVCQKLLLEYAQTYNLVDDFTENGITYNQTYTTPQVTSNFSEIYFGYRNTFFMSGTFLLSYSINPSKFYYVAENGEEILVEAITFSEDFSIQTDTQPFFNTNNFTTSIGKYGTHTINFSTYLTDDGEIEIIENGEKIKKPLLCNKILDIVNGIIDNGVDNSFTFKLEYKNGRFVERTYKLINYRRSQDVGQLPIITCSFTQ